MKANLVWFSAQVLRDVDRLVWPGSTLPAKSVQNIQWTEWNMFYTTCDMKDMEINNIDTVVKDAVSDFLLRNPQRKLNKGK